MLWSFCGQIFERNRKLQCWRETKAETLRNNDGAEDIVAIYKVLKRGAQGLCVERAGEFQSKGFVEGAGGVIAELRGKPDFELRFGEGSFRRRCRHRGENFRICGG